MGQPRYDTDTKAVLHFLGFDSSMVATLHIFIVKSEAMLKACGSGTIWSCKDYALRRYERVQGNLCNMKSVDSFEIRRVFSRIICLVWFSS